jgi:hypothetical protein
MRWTTTVSPSRTKVRSAASAGRVVSFPEAVSVDTRSTCTCSRYRSGCWSTVLTRTEPIRCPRMGHPPKARVSE